MSWFSLFQHNWTVITISFVNVLQIQGGVCTIRQGWQEPAATGCNQTPRRSSRSAQPTSENNQPPSHTSTPNPGSKSSDDRERAEVPCNPGRFRWVPDVDAALLGHCQNDFGSCSCRGRFGSGARQVGESAGGNQQDEEVSSMRLFFYSFKTIKLTINESHFATKIKSWLNSLTYQLWYHSGPRSITYSAGLISERKIVPNLVRRCKVSFCN